MEIATKGNSDVMDPAALSVLLPRHCVTGKTVSCRDPSSELLPPVEAWIEQCFTADGDLGGLAEIKMTITH